MIFSSWQEVRAFCFWVKWYSIFAIFTHKLIPISIPGSSRIMWVEPLQYIEASPAKRCSSNDICIPVCASIYLLRCNTSYFRSYLAILWQTKSGLCEFSHTLPHRCVYSSIYRNFELFIAKVMTSHNYLAITWCLTVTALCRSVVYALLVSVGNLWRPFALTKV